MRHRTGVVHHAEIRVGDSVVEMGESQGEISADANHVLHVRSRLRCHVRPGTGGGGASISEPATSLMAIEARE